MVRCRCVEGAMQQAWLAATATGGGVPGTVGPRVYDRAPPGCGVGSSSGGTVEAPKEVLNTHRVSDVTAIVGARA